MLKFADESNGNFQNAEGSREKTPRQHDLEKDKLGFKENQGNTETLAAATESPGVDNKGFSNDETTARPSLRSLVQITSATVDKEDSNVVVDKPFVVSSDPETGLSASQGHKTVRAWLKDRHLYKVTTLCLWLGHTHS